MSEEKVYEESYAPNLHEAEETGYAHDLLTIEAERRYRDLFNSVSDGVFQTDLEGNYTLVNPAFASIIGVEAEELLNGSLNTWQLYVTEEEKEEILREVSEKGSIGKRVIRLSLPDDSVKMIEVSFSVCRDEKGEPTGYEGVVREITDRVMYKERLEALHAHASKLNNANSVDEVAELTFDTIEQILGFNLVSFSVVYGDFLNEVLNRGGRTPASIKLQVDGPGITVRAVRTGETQLVPDIREDVDYVEGPYSGQGEILSELDVPVKINDKVIAVINLESTKLHIFTEEDAKLVEILAGHVASTIQKIRLLESERLNKEKIEALHRHASELASASTIEDVADITFNAIDRVLGFPLGDFSIVDGDRLTPVFIKGIDIESNSVLPLDGPGVVVRTVKTGESQLVPDTRLDKDYVPAYTDDGDHTLSELAVPITVDSDVKAVLNIESKRLNAFTVEDKRLLEIFAGHVASAFGRLLELGRLRKSEEKFRTLLEESMDAVSVLIGTTIVYANKRMAELVGFDSPSEYIGRDSLDFIVDEDKEMVKTRALGRQRGEKHAHEYEFRMVRTDGSIIDVETFVSVIEYDGKPASLAFNRDVTKRNQMEKELREYTERLEEMVEERTRELRGVERMAAIGELAAMVGHDLRNPLSGIAGAAYFLKKKYSQMEDETTRKMFEIIEKDIKYSNKIVNDLMDFSKTIDLELVKISPRQLVVEALDTIDVPENVKVADTTLDEPVIEVDVQMMKRVLINLITNAVDAMPSGGEITITGELTNHDYELLITDTGVGIPEDILGRIWNPLFTTKSKGMGFGLSICRRILEYHGGSIEVKSKVGEGTSFIILLPRR